MSAHQLGSSQPERTFLLSPKRLATVVDLADLTNPIKRQQVRDVREMLAAY
jgi:hypothetical protein